MKCFPSTHCYVKNAILEYTHSYIYEMYYNDLRLEGCLIMAIHVDISLLE